MGTEKQKRKAEEHPEETKKEEGRGQRAGDRNEKEESSKYEMALLALEDRQKVTNEPKNAGGHLETEWESWMPTGKPGSQSHLCRSLDGMESVFFPEPSNRSLSFWPPED